MSKGGIIDHTWYSPGLGNMPVPYVVTVGIVLVHYPDERYVQAYLGLGSGRDLEQDTGYGECRSLSAITCADIAAWGAKLERQGRPCPVTSPKSLERTSHITTSPTKER